MTTPTVCPACRSKLPPPTDRDAAGRCACGHAFASPASGLLHQCTERDDWAAEADAHEEAGVSRQGVWMIVLPLVILALTLLTILIGAPWSRTPPATPDKQPPDGRTVHDAEPGKSATPGE